MFDYFRRDKYLKNFVKFCRVRYRDNLAGILVYGSYSQGYFDKNESDYDIMIFFEKAPPNSHDIKILTKKFPKTSVQYLVGLDEVLKRVSLNHFISYITILNGNSKLIYHCKSYNDFIRKLKKIDLFSRPFFIEDFVRQEKDFEEELRLKSGFDAIKWMTPQIRRKLQLYNFIKNGNLIWDMEEILIKNKLFLKKDEKLFVFNLNKKMFNRSREFSKGERIFGLGVIKKLDLEITKLTHELNLQN